MGHWCWVCGNILPNEKFSGKGHRRHICKKCAKFPKEEIQKIRDSEFLHSLLNQKTISPKNIKMLEAMKENYEGQMQEQAEAILHLARIRSYKKKRLGFIYHNHRELFDRLVELRLIEDYITPIIKDRELAEAWLSDFESDEDIFQDKKETEDFSTNDYFEDDMLDNDDSEFSY